MGSRGRMGAVDYSFRHLFEDVFYLIQSITAEPSLRRLLYNYKEILKVIDPATCRNTRLWDPITPVLSRPWHDRPGGSTALRAYWKVVLTGPSDF